MRMPRRDEVGPWLPCPMDPRLLKVSLEDKLWGGAYALQAYEWHVGM